ATLSVLSEYADVAERCLTCGVGSGTSGIPAIAVPALRRVQPAKAELTVLSPAFRGDPELFTQDGTSESFSFPLLKRRSSHAQCCPLYARTFPGSRGRAPLRHFRQPRRIQARS